jgi:hypothetical protein
VIVTSAKHPARSVRQMVGLGSIAAFVGAVIAIATHGHNGTQPANAATTPATSPNVAQQSPNYNGSDDGSWGATPPDNSQNGSNQNGLGSGSSNQFNGNGNGNGSFNAPSHSQSSGS